VSCPRAWARQVGVRGRSLRSVVGSGGGFDGDLVAETLDLVGEASSMGVVVAAAVEPVSPEVDVVGLVGQHVPDDDEHRVRDDEDRLGLALFAKPAAERTVLRHRLPTPLQPATPLRSCENSGGGPGASPRARLRFAT